MQDIPNDYQQPTVTLPAPLENLVCHCKDQRFYKYKGNYYLNLERVDFFHVVEGKIYAHFGSRDFKIKSFKTNDDAFHWLDNLFKRLENDYPSDNQ